MALFTKEDIEKQRKAVDGNPVKFERDWLGNLKQSKAPKMSLASRVDLPLPKKQSIEPVQKKSEKPKAIEPIKRMPEVVNKSPQAKPKPMRNIASVVGKPKTKSKIQEKREQAETGMRAVEDNIVKGKDFVINQIKDTITKANEFQKAENILRMKYTENLERMRTIPERMMKNTQAFFEKRQERIRNLEQSLRTPERKKLISETKPMAMLMEFAIKGTFMALHNLALPEGNPYSENNINRGQDFMSLWNQSVEKDYREQIEQQTLLGKQINQLRELAKDDIAVFQTYKMEQDQIMQNKLAYYAANTRHKDKKINALMAIDKINQDKQNIEMQRFQRISDQASQEAKQIADQEMQESRFEHQKHMQTRQFGNQAKQTILKNSLSIKRKVMELDRQEAFALKKIELANTGGRDGLKLGGTPETQIKIADKAALKEARDIKGKYGKSITPSINFLKVVNGTSTDPDHQKFSRTIKKMQGDSFIKQKGKLKWSELKSKGGVPNEYKQTVSWLIGEVEKIAAGKRIDLTGGGNMTDKEKMSLYRATGVSVPVGTKLDKSFNLGEYIVKAIIDETLQGNVKELTKETVANYWSEIQPYTTEPLSREQARKNLLENF